MKVFGFYLFGVVLSAIMYGTQFGWWILLLAPIHSAVTFFFIAVSPIVHKWIFDDKIFDIKVSKEQQDVSGK